MKKYCLKRQSVQSSFILLLLSRINKIFDSINIYKSFNINTETVMKNPEMLKFIPNHF